MLTFTTIFELNVSSNSNCMYVDYIFRSYWFLVLEARLLLNSIRDYFFNGRGKIP